jgi:hypothetical protein
LTCRIEHFLGCLLSTSGPLNLLSFFLYGIGDVFYRLLNHLIYFPVVRYGIGMLEVCNDIIENPKRYPLLIILAWMKQDSAVLSSDVGVICREVEELFPGIIVRMDRQSQVLAEDIVYLQT